MIKISKLNLQFLNCGKKETLDQFIDEYRRVTSYFIDIIWGLDKVPNLLPANITSQIQDTWLSARAIQCAGKQASGIVRGTRKKFEQRLWKIQDFHNKGQHKKARKLENIHLSKSISKPIISTICPELDSRFIQFNFNQNTTSFDGWIVISSIGDKIKISIPLNRRQLPLV